MNQKGFIVLSAINLLLFNLFSQSYRGLSIVSDEIVWISGSKGTVLKTTCNGKKWDTINPSGYNKKDFRDIHAWSEKEAIVMSAGDSAVFLKTKDGGKNWYKVYANNSKGVFFDAIDFKGDKGVSISDPVNVALKIRTETHLIKPFYFIHSSDRGETWQWPQYFVYPMDTTESMFAASGSIIQWVDTSGMNPNCRFVTGGNNPRFLSSEGWINEMLPIQKGYACGAYSFCGIQNSIFIAVGGNYLQPTKIDSTCAYSLDSGKTWKLSTTMPGGYRSCACANNNGKIIACTGTNGSDISKDYGQTWTPLINSDKMPIEGYNVCAFSNDFLWLAGDKGRIKKLAVSFFD